MKKNNKYPYHLILFTFISILLSSCYEEISDDFLTGEPRVVINGIITNEEGPYFVRVTRSNNVLEDFTTHNFTGGYSLTNVLMEDIMLNKKTKHEPILDAIVTLEDNEGNYEILKLSPTKLYYAEFEDDPFSSSLPQTFGGFGIYQTNSFPKGKPGNVYTLTVVSDNVEYKSTVQMPNEAPIIEKGYVKTVKERPDDLFSPLFNDFVVEFNDIVDEVNYYRFTHRWQPFGHNLFATFENNNLNTMLYPKIIAIDDKYLSGHIELSYFSTLINSENFELFSRFIDLPRVEEDSVVLSLYSIKKDVFEYYESIKQQLETDGGAYSPAPATPPGNISNGALGLWQASSVSRKTIHFPLQ